MDTISQIKSEIEKVEKSYFYDVYNKQPILNITKALSVAVESLKHYDHQKIKATKTPCGTGELHPLATEALTDIAEILSGGGDAK